MSSEQIVFMWRTILFKLKYIDSIDSEMHTTLIKQNHYHSPL